MLQRRRASVKIPDLPLSPIPRLLECNDPPEQTELAAVIQAIHRGSECLLLLNDIKPSPFSWTTPKVLRKREHELTEFISAHQRILAPIKRLPNELLALIFGHYAALWEWSARERGLTKFPPSNFLRTVCRHWRAVVLTTPTLWSKLPTMNFVLSLGAPLAAQRFATYQTQMERAGSTPLRLCISWPFPLEHRIYPGDDLALQVHWLASSAERWEVISLNLSHAEFHELCLMVRGRLHSLRKISIRFTTFQHFSHMALTEVYAASPLLQTIMLHGVDCLECASLPPEVVHFSGQYYNSPYIFNLLEPVAATIETCTLSHYHSEQGATPSPPLLHLNLHKLRSLRFWNGDPTIYDEFFDQIRAPSLQSLELCAQYATDCPIRKVFNMIQRSSFPQLQKLLLNSRSVSTDADEVIRILHEVPSLVELGIRANGSIAKRLIYSQGSPLLLPNLRRLYFVDAGLVTSVTLDRLARSRTTALEHSDSSAHACCELEFFALQMDRIDALAMLSDLSYWPKATGTTRLEELASKFASAYAQMATLGEEKSARRRFEELFRPIEAYAPINPIVLERSELPSILTDMLTKSWPSDYRTRFLSCLDRWRPYLEEDGKKNRWHAYQRQLFPDLLVFHDDYKESLCTEQCVKRHISKAEHYVRFMFPDDDSDV